MLPSPASAAENSGSDSPAHARASRWSCGVLGLWLLALTGLATVLLFSMFMLYDDEGYVLFTLKNFTTHGHLYDQVYSQYGPIPYLFYSALHLLGAPITHLTGRVVTVLAWSWTCLLCTQAGWRTTRNLALCLVLMVGSFVYLWVMISEPAHPGGLITLMTAALACYGYILLLDGRKTAWATLGGIVAASLLLTKINVGIFAIVAGGAFFLLFLREGRLRYGWGWRLALLGLLVFPFLLMRPLLATPWVLEYACIFALSALTSIVAAKQGAFPTLGRREVLAFLLGGIGVGALVVGAMSYQGTSLAGLLDGVLLGPLRHPTAFSLAFPWPSTSIWLAIGSALTMGGVLHARYRGRNVDPLVAALRLGASVGVLYALSAFPMSAPDRPVFSFGLPLLWLFLWPLRGEEGNSFMARTWLGLVLLLQSLHAFPVPGSQLAWGTVLALPLSAIGGWAACQYLIKETTWFMDKQRAWAAVSCLLLSVFAGITGGRLHQYGKPFYERRPLLLAGSEMLRLNDGTTANYQSLTLNAVAHTDMLFSLPGMFSFNLWSGLPAPTLNNVTHWFSLLSESQQQEAIRALESHPRAGVILHTDHLGFLDVKGLTPTGPLYDYVMRTFEPVFEVDSYQFCVRKGRKILPLLTAEAFALDEAQAKSGAPDTQIRINLLLTRDEDIASVELARADAPTSTSRVLCGPGSLVSVAQVNLRGESVSAPSGATLPYTGNGPVALSVYFNRGASSLSAGSTLLVVRSSTGREIALVRLLPAKPPQLPVPAKKRLRASHSS